MKLRVVGRTRAARRLQRVRLRNSADRGGSQPAADLQALADQKLQAWIDVGAPSARRLHKATKAARRVALFTHVERSLLLAEADSAPIHRREEIEVWRLEPAFLDPICERLDRKLEWSLTRSDGTLYLGLGGQTFETPLLCTRLIEEPSSDEE